MPGIDHKQLAAALLPSVLAAGAIEMRHYRAGVTIETKADESPVTIADREAETVLVAAISAAAPGIPIVAEEAVAAGRLPTLGDEFFLVDPLDGTREFVARRDEFTVNVALIENGEPVLGVVFAPARRELYWGDVKAGKAGHIDADPDGTMPSLGNAIRARQAPAGGITAVASRSHRTPETDTFLSNYNVVDFRSIGSSLKFCLVATGEADLYPRLGPTMEWDTAAGHAVLRAAGGRVTGLAGEPFRYGKPGFRNGNFLAQGIVRGKS